MSDVKCQMSNGGHGAVISPRLKRKRGLSPREWRDLRTGLLFVSPWIIGVCAFMAYPIVMSFYYSLCDFSVLQPPRFIGLENYRQLFQEDVFMKYALPNTF